MGHVLIVDDDDTIREVLAIILEDAGFACQQAANGLEALRQMRASNARLVVVLDLMMPRMDGRAVLEAVERDPWLAKRHAFVLLTAADKHLPLPLVQVLDRLGVRVVSKPFDLDVFVEAVQRAAAPLGDDRPARDSGGAVAG